MDKKIINLIICVLICVIVIFGLIISQLVMDKDVKTTPETENKLVETVIDDPSGEDGLKIHESENGYTVKYPDSMQAKQMAKAIDFILDDEKSGSSLNIITAKNDGSLKTMTREEFEYSLMSDAVLHSYDKVDLNGVDATVAKFTYNKNNVTQTIIIQEDYGYNITVTESTDISNEMLQIFDNVVQSFTLN